jgi:signal transduction histidine kinase
MSLRTKLAALAVLLTAVMLVGLSVYLAGSVTGWSDDAALRELAAHAADLAALVEIDDEGEAELEHLEAPALSDPSHPYRIIGPQGVLAQRGELSWPSPELATATVTDARGLGWQVVSRRVRLGSERDHEGREHHGRGEASVVVQVAGRRNPSGAFEERFRRGLLWALAITLVLGGAGATLLTRASLSPLRRLEADVSAIGVGSLDRRVSVDGLDPELRRVATAFNGVLERLDEAMQRQRQFVARASHALRTPTASILTRAEVTLRRERDADEYRRALGDVATSARDSAALVTGLLALARLEQHRGALALEPLDLSELAAEVSRPAAPRAEEAGISLSTAVPPGLTVLAERQSLRELLEALLDNALRYTPRGGRVGLRASEVDGAVELVVHDTGPGIPPADRARVLEPFYRGAAAEETGASGSGLGLAIARTIAEAHGTSLVLRDHAGGGLEVGLTLRRGQRAPAAARRAQNV